jgi:hypothetical protein
MSDEFILVVFVGPDGEPDTTKVTAFKLTPEGLIAANAHIMSEKRRDLEGSDLEPLDFDIPSSNWDGCAEYEIEEAWAQFCIGCRYAIL